MTITTVLGETREAVRFYGDSSFDCPFCSSAVVAPATACHNPACDSSPYWSPEALSKHLSERQTLRARQEHDRRTAEAVAESAKERHAEHQAWEAEQMAEARRRGSCLNCLFQAGWERVKFITHRGPCPKGRR